MSDLREKIARALTEADGKDPDAPAWGLGYGNREQTFGICWRDQYSGKADAILAIPEIRDALELKRALETPGTITFAPDTPLISTEGQTPKREA